MKKNRTQIQSLMELRAKPGKKQTTVGLIVNITKPFKTANAEDYVTKLKVIDQSLNCNTILERKAGEKELRKYLHVFIYTKTLELAPSIKCIGDIIYLKRYDFSTYAFTGQEQEELKCLNRQYYSRYYTFHGFTDSLQTEVDVVQKCSEEDYEPNDILIQRVTALRLFARGYFSKQSLQETYLQGSTDIDQSRQEHTDFDMVLRVVSSTATEQAEMVSLTLQDAQGHLFYCQCLQFNYAPADVVEVRSVSHIDYQSRIVLNQYSSIIRVPPYFKDFVEFDTLYNYSLKYSAQYKHILADQVFYNDDGQMDRDQALERGIHSVLKHKYEQTEFTPFKQVYGMSLKRASGVQAGPYKLQAMVYQLHTQTLREALQNFCRICNKVTPFSREVSSCCQREVNTVLNIKFTLCDSKKQDMVEVYVFTFDENPRSFLPFVECSAMKELKEKEFQEVEKQYADWAKVMEKEENRKYDLILQGTRAEEKVLLRVIDTFLI